METIDIFFLLSFIVWIIIGYGIYRKFYTSIEEIMATTEIKKSRAMQYRAEHLVSSLKTSIFFSIFLSLGVNFIGLLIYSWIYTDFPSFSYTFFLFSSLIVLIAYPLGELHYLCEKEHQAEPPYHKALRSIIRKLVGKVKGKTEAVLVFSLIFYLVPILLLKYGLNFEFLFSIFIVFLIYPILTVAYFIAYGIFKLFSPVLFLHNLKNIRLYLGLTYTGLIILFILGLFLNNTYFIIISLLTFVLVLTYGIIKDLKYRPIELAHIIDDVARPFEWVHGSFLILGFGLLAFLTMYVCIPGFSVVGSMFVPVVMEGLIKYMIIGVSFLIPFFLLIIIISKSKYYTRALVVALTKDSMKLNAAIKSKYIHDKTLIETIEKSVNQNYIRPEYTPKLYRLLNNEDTHIRRKAIILLRKITEDDRFKSVSIAPNLLNFLKNDKIWTVRLEATESLTNMMKILPKVEVKKIFDFLSELEPDKNRYVRWGIVRLFNSIALAREDTIHNVMKFLYKGLEDDEWSVRKGTVESFNELVDGFPDLTVDLLASSLKLLTDEDTDIVKEVFNLIQKTTGTSVTQDNLQLLESQISEKIGVEREFNVNILANAIEKIVEEKKPPKFVFKRSQLRT